MITIDQIADEIESDPASEIAYKLRENYPNHMVIPIVSNESETLEDKLRGDWAESLSG